VIQRPDYEDYVILLIEVPESHDAPHIHSNGKIYTRTGEGSDPISAETDRWTLDKLYERRTEWDEKVDQFCRSDITLTRGQSGDTEHQTDGWPFLELYGIPSTLGDPVCANALKNIADFKSILEQSETFLPNAEEEINEESSMEMGRTYDAYRASSDAVVAQQWSREGEGRLNAASAPETVKFFADGSLKALLYVPVLDLPESIEGAWSQIHQSLDGDIEYIRFLDGGTTLVSSYVLLNSYLNLPGEFGWVNDMGRDLHFKARIRNGYRSILMFEGSWFTDLIAEFGPPISYENTVEMPYSGTHLLYSEDESEFSDLLYCSAMITEGFGLPWEMHTSGNRELWDLILSYRDYE
jgi:hypothetical protein